MNTCECGCGAVVEKRFVHGHNQQRKSPEHHRERRAQYRRDNPDKMRAQYERKKAKRTDEHRRKDAERSLAYHYRRKFNMTIEEVRAWHETVTACEICGGPPLKKNTLNDTGSFAIDHCHTTGQVRGLLCDPCNLAIGLFKDSPETLQAAINYLEKHRDGHESS